MRYKLTFAPPKEWETIFLFFPRVIGDYRVWWEHVERKIVGLTMDGPIYEYRMLDWY